MPSILVADVGGTHGRFAVAPFTGTRYVRSCEAVRSFECSAFTGFTEMLDAYTSGLSERPEHACFGIAGPVADGVAQLTNVAFRVSSAEIAQRFGFERVSLINDIQALASAVPYLPPHELEALQGGAERREGARTVIGAGTGFGCAMLVPANGRWLVNPTEAGHQGFAPADDLEVEVVERLRRQAAHVSVETLLSGPGLVRLHSTLCAIKGLAAEPLSAEEICKRATLGGDTVHAATLRVFFSMLGSVAGNLALAHGATGGVYLGGGVLSKNAHLLPLQDFLERFHAKGPMQAYVRSIPVYLIRSEHAALRGAAQWLLERGLE